MSNYIEIISQDPEIRKSARKLDESALVFPTIPSFNNKINYSPDLELIFLDKIRICSIIPNSFTSLKVTTLNTEKQKALQDLITLLENQKNVKPFFIPHFDLIQKMILNNILRPIKSFNTLTPIKLEPNETEIQYQILIPNPSYPYLKKIYELFYNILSCKNLKDNNFKAFFSQEFFDNFIELFQSNEPDEREMLKNILFKLYTMNVSCRKIIRKVIRNFLLTIIYDRDKVNGVYEILEMLLSVVIGYNVPLLKEHIDFFYCVLIPLHKVHNLYLYHTPLLHCSMLLMIKDKSLPVPYIQGLLRYWPVGDSDKEILFISEINEVIGFCEMSLIEPIIIKLFKRLIRCIASPHVYVSDRVLGLFENDYFLDVVKNYRVILFPIIFPVVIEIEENYWFKSCIESFKTLKNILINLDKSYFERYLENAINTNTLHLMSFEENRLKAEAKWEELTKIAGSLDPCFEIPVVPYAYNIVINRN